MSQSIWPTCEADWTSDCFGGCHAPSRYLIERPGEGYSPTEACPAHVADMMAYLVDGEDVPLTVHVRFDDPPAPSPEPDQPERRST